jgi:hypothetical protein
MIVQLLQFKHSTQISHHRIKYAQLDVFKTVFYFLARVMTFKVAGGEAWRSETFPI